MAFPTEGIIDAHVHLYPDEVNRDPLGWARRAGETIWASLVEDRPDRRARQGFVSVDQLLRDMDSAGVAHAVLLGWYWQHQETCVAQNRFYAQCVRAHPDRISAFATVQASAGEAAREEMRRARDEGLIGLGELCPWAFGASPADADWLAVFRSAQSLRWPVNLHVTDPVSRPIPGRVCTPLEDVVDLAEKCPELRLILAHLGGGLVFHEFGRRARKALRRAVYDTAAVPLLYRREVYEAAMGAAGEGRVMFGTDYPLITFPAKQDVPGFDRSVEHVRMAVDNPDAAESILGGAARAFFAPRLDG